MIFFVFEVSYAHSDCIYLIKNTVKIVIMLNIIKILNSFSILNILKCN